MKRLLASLEAVCFPNSSTCQWQHFLYPVTRKLYFRAFFSPLFSRSVITCENFSLSHSRSILYKALFLSSQHSSLKISVSDDLFVDPTSLQISRDMSTSEHFYFKISPGGFPSRQTIPLWPLGRLRAGGQNTLFGSGMITEEHSNLLFRGLYVSQEPLYP